MAFSGFTEMFAKFAKVLCLNVPSPFFSLSQFFVVSLPTKNYLPYIKTDMKKSILWVAAGMMTLAACQKQAGYTIQGTVEGVADGDTVYLQNFENNNLVKIDSAIVKNGTFEFKGQADSIVKSSYVTYMKNDKRMLTLLFVENGNIKVALNEKDSQVSGTPCNDTYQNFMTSYKAIGEELKAIYTKAQQDSTLTAEQRDSLMTLLDEKQEQGMDKVYQTISDCIETPVGVHLLVSFASSFDIEKVEPLLNKIPAAYANDEGVVALKEHAATVAKTAVGKKFIDFEMNTPEGKSVKLSDFISKNKYTLIDFWASWCGPCRQEMPNVVAAYNEFKAKGFGIVGVSLDNNLESWKKAIKDLNITWAQMSDLKGWQCEGAALYGVRAIPATVLVDQEGTIVARNLRGDELKAKLAELMK